MKKYLFSALALPLLFACSSDDLIEKEVASNDPFPGIEKVDAKFIMDEGPVTRMATTWELERGDKFGFAWLGTTAPGTDLAAGTVVIDGNAYQNHPLSLVKEGDRTWFQPQTSIYVGKYYLYLPYDESTVAIGPINFNSLATQTITDGETGKPWRDLAKNAINIGDKWTNVTAAGDNDGYNKAGIDKKYHLYAAMFSNQSALDLTYLKNNPTFNNATEISGATDIVFTIAAGDEVGAAKILGGTFQLAGAKKSFTYAPTAEPNNGVHSGTFWANKKGGENGAVTAANGFTFPGDNDADIITLNVPEGGIATGPEGNTGWFWFNSLPVTNGVVAANTAVNTTFNTSYGLVTVNKTLCDGDQTTGCAYALEVVGEGDNAQKIWHKLIGGDQDNNDVNPSQWALEKANRNLFVREYGNHQGKYKFTVDFSTGQMNGMHIVDDDHLQTALKYFIASGKKENVVLNLDGKSATDKTFELSKISIALLQTINRTGAAQAQANQYSVKVQACEEHNNPVKIIVTQKDQTGDLANKKEVPALDNVFAVPTEVYLSKNCTWTWDGEIEAVIDNVLTAGALPIDANVISITNEGTLNVTNANVQLSIPYQAAVPAQEQQEAQDAKYYLVNAAGATMDINPVNNVTTVKNPLTNFGTIDVNENKELQAYGIAITNDRTDLRGEGKVGIINNSGVVGVTYNTAGQFNNYGKIIMETGDAMTLLTRNQTANDNTSFKNPFDAETNKLGIVVLPDNDPTAIVSVNNEQETGIIEYNLPEDMTTYVTPTGNVKFNTVVVTDDITFTEAEPEIQYIKFKGTRIKVVNQAAANLPQLKGIYVTDGSSIIIEKTNVIVCSQSAFLGTGAAIYNGGTFTDNATKVGTVATNYLGTWSTDQVVVYSGNN